MLVITLATRLTSPLVTTHRPLSSSFLGLPYRILSSNHKKELLRGLWIPMKKLQAKPEPSILKVQAEVTISRSEVVGPAYLRFSGLGLSK